MLRHLTPYVGVLVLLWQLAYQQLGTPGVSSKSDQPSPCQCLRDIAQRRSISVGIWHFANATYVRDVGNTTEPAAYMLSRHELQECYSNYL